MDCCISVVSGVQMLVGADGIKSFGTLVQVADDTGLVEFGERSENGVCVPKVRTPDNFEVPMPDQRRAGSSECLNLGQALRAIAASQPAGSV